MGKGKGNVDHHIFKVKAGIIIYEIETKFTSISIKALKLAQRRLPFKTKIIYN
jgi:large subunit ribosomal protein L16